MYVYRRANEMYIYIHIGGLIEYIYIYIIQRDTMGYIHI